MSPNTALDELFIIMKSSSLKSPAFVAGPVFLTAPPKTTSESPSGTDDAPSRLQDTADTAAISSRQMPSPATSPVVRRLSLKYMIMV